MPADFSRPPPWWISVPGGSIRFVQVFLFALVFAIPMLILPGRPRGWLLKLMLATLGGAWQKLAQVLAQQPKLIGQHAAEYLSHLQDRGRKRSHAVLLSRIAKAKGLDRSHLDLSATGDSVAAASCGAVYKAKWDGKLVAIKVTIAGARITYTMDRALLRGVAVVVGWTPPGRRMRLHDQLRKIADSYYAQLDLREEAFNTTLMFKSFAPNFNRRMAARGSTLKIKIPEVYFNDRDILIVDWIEATKATKVLADARSPDEAVRTAAVTKYRAHGEIVIEAAVWASLRQEVTHGDLHAGNVYFSDEGVILLDFGLCSRVPSIHRLRLAAGLLSTAGGDPEGVARSLISMAPNPPKLTPDQRQAFVDGLAVFINTINEKIGAGSTTQGLPLGSLLTNFLTTMRQHRVEPHPGFAVMNQNLLAAQGFVGALAPDFDLVSIIRDEVIALYRDEDPESVYVKQMILLPSVVGLARKDEKVEELLVSTLDLSQAMRPASGHTIEMQLAAMEEQTSKLAPLDIQAYYFAMLQLRHFRGRPAFRAKVLELLKMLRMSPPNPFVQVTIVFLQNLVAE